ncbi:Phospholipase A1-IIgamma [Linum grandiflorum]
MGSIAENWKKLSGQDNWEGLTDPLDPDFRRYLIHYGERLQAVYDAINGETLSKAYGYSRYPPEDFFTRVFLQNGNPYQYQITKFFYASSEFTLGDCIVAGGSAWMGYVAVCTEEGKAMLGRRDIMVCWRGTMTFMEWVQDFNFPAVSVSDVYGKDHNPKAHHGFFSCYTHKNPNSTYNKTSAREQVLSEVRRLVDKYRDEETSITVVGHSLGASLATLNATDIVANNYHKPTGSTTGCLVTGFVYASPLVGDSGFHNMFNTLTDLRLLRIRNFDDPVPLVPPKFFGFFEVGKELLLHIFSPYLKPSPSPHNLELYMHGVAGYNGLSEFKLMVERDIALVNKGADHLKDKYKVPPKWWNVKNKAMYQLEDGSWEMHDYIPPPPEDVVL